MRILTAILIAGCLGCLLFCGIIAPSLITQSVQAVQEGQSVLADSKDQVETFSGRIISQNRERFILREDSDDVCYHLDDQQKASKFFGKKVLVTGALDGRTDTIRVQSITEGA